MGQRGSQTFFESPHAVTYVLILLNSAAFGLTLLGNSLAQIDPATLFHYGAIYKDAVTRKEYWRFIAYAFLHANVLHFALNMLCIAAWSGLLEKRLGATYFILVYLASAIGGGVASLYGHPGPFLTVGASGAISGIVGGLLCLTILGKLQLSAQFFVITIGINAALAARVPNVDWMAHLGGFTAGVAACALLDALETLNRYWLRCKFPEFVKFGIATAAFAAVVLFHSRKPLQADIDILASAAAGSAVILLVTKLADLILARPKGLAVLVFAIAAFYGGLLLLVSSAMTDTLPAYCEKAGLLARNITEFRAASPYIGAACRHISLLPVVLALITFVTALFLLRAELRRGLNDVGFVANTLRAERKRRQGL